MGKKNKKNPKKAGIPVKEEEPQGEDGLIEPKEGEEVPDNEQKNEVLGEAVPENLNEVESFNEDENEKKEIPEENIKGLNEFELANEIVPAEDPQPEEQLASETNNLAGSSASELQGVKSPTGQQPTESTSTPPQDDGGILSQEFHTSTSPSQIQDVASTNLTAEESQNADPKPQPLSDIPPQSSTTDIFANASAEIDELFESLGTRSKTPQLVTESTESLFFDEGGVPKGLSDPLANSDMPLEWASGPDDFDQLISGSVGLAGDSVSEALTRVAEEMVDEVFDGPPSNPPKLTTDPNYSQEVDTILLESRESLLPVSPQGGSEAMHEIPTEIFGNNASGSFGQSLIEDHDLEGLIASQTAADEYDFFDQVVGADDASASFFDSLGAAPVTDPFQSQMSTLANPPYTTDNSGQTLFAADSGGFGQDGSREQSSLPQTTELGELDIPIGDDYRDALASRASGYVSYEEQRNLFSFSALPSQRSVAEHDPVTEAESTEVVPEQSYDPTSYQAEQYHHTGYSSEYGTGYQATQNAEYSTGYGDQTQQHTDYHQTGYPMEYQNDQYVDYQMGYQGGEYQQSNYQDGQNIEYQAGYSTDYPAGYQAEYQTNEYLAEYPTEYTTEYQGTYQGDYQAGNMGQGVYQTEYQDTYQGDFQTAGNAGQGEYQTEYQEAYQGSYQGNYQENHQGDYPSGYPEGYQAEYQFNQDTHYQSNGHAAGDTQEGYYQPEQYEVPPVNGQHFGTAAIEPSLEVTNERHGQPAEGYVNGAPQLDAIQDISNFEGQNTVEYVAMASYESSGRDVSLAQHNYTQELAPFVPEQQNLNDNFSSQAFKLETTLENVALSDDTHWENSNRSVVEPSVPPFQAIGLDDLIMPAEMAATVPLPNSPENLSDELRHGRRPCGLFHFGFGGQTVSMVPKVVTRFGAEGIETTKVYPSNITLTPLALDIPVEDHYGPLSSDSKDSDHLAGEIVKNWAKRCPDAGASLLSDLLHLFLQRDGKWEGSNDAICDLLRPDLIPLQQLPSTLSTPSSSLVPQLHQMLLSGQRQEAARLAGSQGAWGHALIIASCAGKELWQETVQAFTRQELNHCEGLSLAYGLFAGLGKYAVNEVAGRGAWKEKLALMFANRTPGDSIALCTLGDELLSTDVAAAHACYLLSTHAPLDSAAPRFVLIGAPLTANLAKANDALRLTECYEFALTKSGSPGLNFLQAHKLHRAWALAGAGRLEDALNYCEAISTIVTPHPPSTPYYHHALRTQLGNLVDRIKHANGFKPADSAWIKKRPTFGSLMNAMEGRINQLVLGDDDAPVSETPTMELQPGPTVFRNNSPQHPRGMLFRDEGIHRSVSNERFGPHQRSLLDSHPAGRRSASPHLMSSPFGHAKHLTSPFGHTARQPSPNHHPQEGLFSPLAAPSIASTPEPIAGQKTPQRISTPSNLDDDDLGFGNKAPKPKPPPVQDPEPVKKQEDPPASDSAKSSGLFGGIWNTFFGGKSGEQKPVYKAKLGEENSFYYDETQKRWINKAAGDTAAPPAAAPPPPRATPNNNSSPAQAKPGSPLSVGGPPGAMGTPPPPGGAGRPKKGARGRYVDIFNAPS